MTTAATTPRLRIVLLLSLLLNVALLVAVSMSWWRHGGEGGRGPRFGGVVRMPQLEVLQRALPAADLPVLQAAYAEHRPQIGTHFRAMREAKREVRSALIAEPFDRARLTAALQAMRGGEQGVATAAHALLVDVAAGVSPEGRQALAKIVTSRRMWRGPREPRAREGRNPPPPAAPPAPAAEAPH